MTIQYVGNVCRVYRLTRLHVVTVFGLISLALAKGYRNACRVSVRVCVCPYVRVNILSSFDRIALKLDTRVPGDLSTERCHK